MQCKEIPTIYTPTHVKSKKKRKMEEETRRREQPYLLPRRRGGMSWGEGGETEVEYS